MSTRRVAFVSLPVVALLIPSLAFAQETKPVTPPAKPERKVEKVEKAPEKPAETWVVAEIGDKLRVYSSSELKTHRDMLKKDHEAAMSHWRERQKAATEEKKPFTEKEPMLETVKVIKDGFKAEADAKTYLETYKKQHEKKPEADGTKKPTEGTKKPKSGDGGHR